VEYTNGILRPGLELCEGITSVTESRHWLPGGVPTRVTNPLDEILEARTTATLGQDLLNLVNFGAIFLHDLRRRTKMRLRTTWVRNEPIEVRLETAHIEHGVDTKARWKVKLVRVGTHYSTNSERTDVLIRQLRCTTCSLELKVLG
jgi:hypothetical protein